MTSETEGIEGKRLDWPLIAFFILGYAVAWRSLAVLSVIARQLGVDGALPHLQARMTPFRASLIIGLFWGAWHLSILVGRAPLAIVAFILLSFGLSFIFTWLFNGSSESLIPGLLFRATQNWEEGFETLFPGLVGTDWDLVSTLGLLVLGIFAGFVVWRQGKGGSV
jgi:hypothetical protein